MFARIRIVELPLVDQRTQKHLTSKKIVFTLITKSVDDGNASGSCDGGIAQTGDGTATLFARTSIHAHLTFIRSEPDDRLIRRTATDNGVSATYAGSLRGDRYSGTIVYSSPGHSENSTGSWNASVPQTHCDPKPSMEAVEARSIGQTALMFHRDREAFDCYLVAARAGDSTA